MTTILTGAYIGIVIMGAIIVAITAFFIMKSTSKRGIVQPQKLPVENVETSAALKERHAPTRGPGRSRLRFPSLGLGLGKFGRQRHDAPPDQPPIDEGLAINEQFSIPLPGVNSSEPEINAVPLSLDQAVPSVEPAGQEEPEVNTLDTSPAEPAESSQDQSQEEPELIEGEAEEPASDSESQKQPKTEDSVFDLFKDEIVEESDISKLAVTLNNVDAHDVLEEAQNLINQLRGARE